MDPLNTDLSAYTADELAAQIEARRTALSAIFAAENPSPADVTEARRIKGEIDSLKGEQSARLSAASEMSSLREQFSQEEEVPAEEEEEEAPAEEPAAPAEAPAQEPAPVTASAPRRRSAREAAAAIPETPPADAQPPAITIIASAEVPGFATGARLTDLNDVASAVVAKMRGFAAPAGVEGGQMQRFSVATFRKEFPTELTTNGGGNDQDVLDHAGKESRLEGGNLIAAGGWCAPSETLYDLCEGETTDGMVDLPEINVARGGIRTTPGPDFATLYANTGFTQTEAQAIAGTAKTCYEVVCPTFTETRLDAVGVCIKAPILTNSAYPELTRRVVSGSLIAHEHRVNASTITKMVTIAGAAVAAGSVGSVASNALNAVELVAETLRGEYRLGLNVTLEVVAPWWLKAAIRADLANRNGVDLLAVSDQTIASYFAVRKVRVQFVYDWQMLVNGEEGYPTTAQLLVYPAGTYVKGTTDVINLDAVYDAAELSVNRYTGLFFEEGVLVAQRCFKAKLVTITVAAGGLTGNNNNTAVFNLI